MIPRHSRGIFFLGSKMSRSASSKKYFYIILNKPYGVLSRFSDESGRKTLRDLGPFPSDVYPVGRLDADSEGLLLLTNDNELKHRLLDPGYGHKRTYLAQVEQIPGGEAVDKLRSGVVIEGRKTRDAEVRLLRKDPGLPARETPIRLRKSVPTAWLEITLTEGRNRQVRKMTGIRRSSHPSPGKDKVRTLDSWRAWTQRTSAVERLRNPSPSPHDGKLEVVTFALSRNEAWEQGLSGPKVLKASVWPLDEKECIVAGK